MNASSSPGSATPEPPPIPGGVCCWQPREIRCASRDCCSSPPTRSGWGDGQAAAPADPTTLLTLAQALIEADLDAHAGEADQLLSQVLQLVPRGEIAEKARRASMRIAEHNLRRSQGEGLRPAVVAAVSEALRTYAQLSQAQRKAVLMEAATIGEKGLAVNQPIAGMKTLHNGHIGLIRPGKFNPSVLAWNSK